MLASNHEIMARLQREILSLQGYHSAAGTEGINIQCSGIEQSFPGGLVPTGAVHEFISASAENASATAGFVAAILSGLMKKGGVMIWIGAARNIFPPAMVQFGILPEQVIFIDVKNEKELLWVTEQALKCEGISAVVSELKQCNLTASRRLQLAVEHSRVTGIILHHHDRPVATTAAIARWRVVAAPCEMEDDLPGVGFPRWNVSLLKVRNGKPGSWTIEWNGTKLCHVPETIAFTIHKQHKKAG